MCGMGVLHVERVHISLPSEVKEFFTEEAKRLNLPYTNYISSILIQYSDKINKERIESKFVKYLLENEVGQIDAKELLEEVKKIGF